MSNQEHWENVYQTKSSDAVSWFQPHADKSLSLINSCNLSLNDSIIDVGAGASVLVDDLLQLGYSNIALLDISKTALDLTKNRLGEKAGAINWLAADITQTLLPKNEYQLWHDRAVFHFLTDEPAREAYKKNLLHALKAKGFLVIATFADDGPEKCSNLNIVRYSSESLFAEFSSDFDLLTEEKETHQTPFNTAQSFVYAVMQRK